MYKIFCDGVCIYNPRSPLFNTKVDEPVLTLEENTAGSLEFKMDSKNIAYYTMKRMASRIVVTRDEKEIFWGRVLSIKEDFFHRKSVHCEGALTYLNDTYQMKTEYKQYTWRQYLEAVLNYHNSKVEDDKKFYIGICEFYDGDETQDDEWDKDNADGEVDMNPDDSKTEIMDKYTAYEKTYKTVMDVVSDFANGYIRLRKETGKFYLDFLKSTRNRCTQVIEFGKNLMDFTRNYDMSNLATVLFPLGSTIEKDVSTVGKEITLAGKATMRRYVSENNKGKTISIDADGNILGMTYVTYNRINVKQGDKYYYSGRQNNGYAMYVITNDELTVHTIKYAGDNEGYTDLTNDLIQIPAGATRLYVGGCDIENYPVEVHEYTEEDNSLDDYVNITSVNNGSYTIQNDTAVATYGHIEAQRYWPKVKDPQVLLKKAEDFLKNYQFDEMTLDVTVLDLHNLNPDIGVIDFLDEVRCISKPHGLDKIFPVNRTTIPLAHPENQTFQLNYQANKTLTSVNSDIQSQIYDRIEEKPSARSVLLDAYKNASALINDAKNGFVLYEKDETLWMNSPDKETATSVWRFNINGLGHASGEGAYYMRDNMNIAITMDGQIVADRITTGHMSADRIYGGTLQLGGLNGQKGVMSIYDEEGTRWGYWTDSELLIGSKTKYHEWGDNMFADDYKGYTYWDKHNFGTRFINGVMAQYFNGRLDSWIGTNEVYKFEPLTSGDITEFTRLGISSRYAIALASPSLYVANKTLKYNESMSDLPAYRGYTGTIKHYFNIRGDGSGGLNWNYEDLRFVNGLLVYYNSYPNDEGNYSTT